MRTGTFTLLNIADCVVRYPDEMCFAFNPNFVEFESSWPAGVLTVTVEKLSGLTSIDPQTIKISFYKGKTRIYLSRLFELMFDDPRNTRCVEAQVQIKIGVTTLFTFSTLVIWGNLAVGERFGNLGVYKREDNKQYFERNLIWFKKFPFTVSLFRYNREVQFYGRVDSGRYGSEPIYRDTKVCLFEKIEKYASKLPDMSSVFIELPFQIV